MLTRLNNLETASRSLSAKSDFLSINMTISAAQDLERLVDGARGCMLGLMLGDALGAPFEGMQWEELGKMGEVKGFVAAVPMGTFVSAGEPGQYREARLLKDVHCVPPGPPKNDIIRAQCARYGCYTDDTNSCIGVAEALLANMARPGGGTAPVDPAIVAKTVARLFRDNELYRGCPPTAKKLQEIMLNDDDPSVSVLEVGLPPHFPFPGGSFANGGAMRISPVGIAFYQYEYLQEDPAVLLYKAVEDVCLGSHRHREAIDFAFVQAYCVQFALKLHCAEFNIESRKDQPREVFDGVQLLEELVGVLPEVAPADGAILQVVQATLEAVRTAYKTFAAGSPKLSFEELTKYTVGVLKSIVKDYPRPGSGFEFQIASVHMCPCVLYVACLTLSPPMSPIINPESAADTNLLPLQLAISIGGDTDTTATMVGAIAGALLGEKALTNDALDTGKLVKELENGPHGRDYALDLGGKLALESWRAPATRPNAL